MANYQRRLSASEASAATASHPEPYRPSPSGSARSSTNPPSTSTMAYKASSTMGNPVYHHPYGNASSSSSLPSPKLPPGLPECPEKDVDTFIGCPIVVLLQHKDFCAVKLQAIEEGTHAIKCRNCPYQTSEPMAMLDHLARLHKRYTDTQYLCQLNNTFMGQKPVCFGVTGYDELPDGLSDFLDGIYRWDKRTQTSVIVFPCRLCPLCYLTKSDLKTHYLSHQQALLSHNHPSVDQPMYICRICRQEFQDFISYYDHHMWMKLSDEVLPPEKQEIVESPQKVPESFSQVSPTPRRGYNEAGSFPKPVAKQPRLMDQSQSASMRGIPHTKTSSSSGEQALNLSVSQSQMSIVDQAMTYPPYQTISDKQLQEGNVHLSCPYCQAVYKYRHWLAMHLQNIHGVKDKRALAEALSTSYAKSAANYYVSKADNLSKSDATKPGSQQRKDGDVIVISSEKKEEPPTPRPNNKILEALKLVPKSHPSLNPPPAQYLHTRSSLKRKLEISERKPMMPHDDDEGIGEMDSEAHIKPLIINMPLSLQAKQADSDKPIMYQHSVEYTSAKHQKSQPRGRPKKDQRQQQGNLAALCDKLAKRVEHKQDRDSPKKSPGGTDDGNCAPVTCDICNKTFKHKNQLWGHKKTHSKIYTCRSGNDALGTKVKSSRLGRRQNIPNFRDVANGKVPPLSEKISTATPEKRSRNTLGSTKGSKHKPLVSHPSTVVTPDDTAPISKEAKRLLKKKKKRAKKKRKALSKVIRAYKDGSHKKKLFLKEGNNAFYPRRFFARYCIIRRQEKTRKKLADLRQAVLLQIDASTKKNVYECLKCHRFHRYQRRCLQHFQDKHLKHKKQSQKLAPDSPEGNKVKKGNVKVPAAPVNSTASDEVIKRKSCHYCNTPGFKCSSHDIVTDTKKQFEVRKDDNGRNFFSCLICHKVFAFQSAILRHLNSHQTNQYRDVPCPSCTFIAKSPLSLAAHSRVHKKSAENGSFWERLKKKQATKVPVTKPFKKSFKCDQCARVFHNLNTFRIHKSEHKDCFPYKCNQCPACFKQPEDMYDHIQTMHSTKNLYQCKTCTYSTANHTTFLKHESGHQRDENKEKLKYQRRSSDVMPPPAHSSMQSPYASSCNAEALDLRMTVNKGAESPEKEKSVKDGKEDENKGKNVENTVEKKKDADDGEKMDDDENKEKVKQMSKSPTEDEIIQSLSVKFEKIEVASGSDEGGYFCTECNFTTNVQDSYLRHFKMHERAEMLTCEECQFPVYDQQGLEEHMLKAHNKSVNKLACDMCQYVTSVPERMVRHKRLHKRMTLKCDQCGYCTPEKRFMIRHILTVHEQQRPFSCEKCTYTTAYKHHLKRHYRLHKQQILQCPKCVHCTLDEKLMLQHIQSHKNDTDNVTCNVCKREFVNTKSLGIHKARDHGKQSLSVEDAINHLLPGRQYKCQVSSVTTHQETSLQLHTVSSAHEGSLVVYTCKKCSFTTTHQGNITVHMMQEHIEDEEALGKIQDLRDVMQCAQCGFCTSKDQLEAHMRSHLEKDIYRCNKCDFKTPHVESMERHSCEQVDVADGATTEAQNVAVSEGDERELVDNKQELSQYVEQSTKCQENAEQDDEALMDTNDTIQEVGQVDTSQQMNDQIDNTKQQEDTPKKDCHDQKEMTTEVVHKQESTLNKIEKNQEQGQDVNKIEQFQERDQDLDNNSIQPVNDYLFIKTEPESEIEKTESECVDSGQATISSDPESGPVFAVEQGSKVQESSGMIQDGEHLHQALSCQLCEETFHTENALKNHVKADHTRLMVNAQNPFVCVFCPYSSCSEKEARRHIGLHNYDLEFKCEYCMFSTTTASSIATHRKVHRTKQRHSTFMHKRKNVCQRVPATLIGNYASGILIDVGGSPQRRYPCKFCGDVFQVAEEWQHHERRHLMVWNMEQDEAAKQAQQSC